MTPWVVRGGTWDYLVLTRVDSVLIGRVSDDRHAPQKEHWRAMDAETTVVLGSFPRLKDAAAFLWARHAEKGGQKA